MLPEFNYRVGSDLTEDDLRTTSNRYRHHVAMSRYVKLPKDFVWEQVLRTGDYKHWARLNISPLPNPFALGTTLRGTGGPGAVVGDFHAGYSLHLFYDVNLLVLEVRGYSDKTEIRLCLDKFYSSNFKRMLGDKKKHESEAEGMLRRFVAHCERTYLASGHGVDTDSAADR